MENKRRNFDENLHDLIEFCKRENRLPRKGSRNRKEEGRLNGFMKNYKDDIKIIEIKEEYSKNKSFNENLQDLVEFCKRENRLPQKSYSNKEDRRLRSFMDRYKKDSRIIEIREYYRKHIGGGRKSKFKENLQNLIEFCKRENRLPQPNFGKEESRLVNFIYVYKDDIRVVEIKEKYSKNKSFDENLQDLIRFCERENRLPQESYSKSSRLRSFMKRYKEDPRIIAIKKKYGKRGA